MKEKFFMRAYFLLLLLSSLLFAEDLKKESLFSFFPTLEGVKFSCNNVLWEKASNILTLKGNVRIQDEGIGQIDCEEEVEVQQKELNGKWFLKGLKTKGKTQLQYQLNEDFKHLLICWGQVLLDQDKLVVTLDSPHEKPIEYYHDKMKFVSDQAQLDYTQNTQKPTAQRLILSGNVRLCNEDCQTRCAVADQLTYFPAERKMILSSQKEKMVLFCDETQQLTISAKEVQIIRNEKGESIRGIGNVRFAFSNLENTLLKKIFPFYQASGGNK